MGRRESEAPAKSFAGGPQLDGNLCTLAPPSEADEKHSGSFDNVGEDRFQRLMLSLSLGEHLLLQIIMDRMSCRNDQIPIHAGTHCDCHARYI